MKLNHYEQYLFELSNEIIKFLVKNGSSIEDSQDIVQEAIIKLLEIDNVIPSEKIRSWLYKVALNSFYNLYKRKKRYDEIIERYFHTDFDITIVEADYSILYASLEELSSKEVNLLLMKYEQKLSFKEIGFILNRPEESLRTELYRARKKLKAIYLKKEDENYGI
ncbi:MULTISPECIES: sigma-70 family RNA polymerase sigma factor [Vagococcus]|uniref:RNA polymerase sigma factor n=1 Tax=Vagococcus TaxID=2737 RepID=UPI002FC6FEAF